MLDCVWLLLKIVQVDMMELSEGGEEVRVLEKQKVSLSLKQDLSTLS